MKIAKRQALLGLAFVVFLSLFLKLCYFTAWYGHTGDNTNPSWGVSMTLVLVFAIPGSLFGVIFSAFAFLAKYLPH